MPTVNLVQSLAITRKGLATTPGVYRFYNAAHELLYVGKARNLRKRVESYFRNQPSLRISTLLRQIAAIETTVTATENEALLLESNLIKALKPRYNIILRDDKSYPYIVLSDHAQYPRLGFYRGRPRDKTCYFGPYPSIASVRETLNFLQKLFRIRPCRDSFFQRRTRPCLQYQIQRCSAPCVNLITPEAYQADIQRVRLFLQGKDATIIAELRAQMAIASAQLDYETAARLRDQIADLRQIQQQQAITTTTGEADVIAHAHVGSLHCLYVLRIRGGRVLGGHAYFPVVPTEIEVQAVVAAFLPQLYLNTMPASALPAQIIVAEPILDQAWLMQALSEQAGYHIQIRSRPRGDRLRWLQLAQQNAEQALVHRTHTQQHKQQQLSTLQQALGLQRSLHRLECFDISHSQGEATVAACVVLDFQGLRKQDYRRFNLTDITPGDDYAAMHQALTRYYRRRLQDAHDLPELLVIDGGKGQLTQAMQLLKTLTLDTRIQVVAIAKGPSRKPGEETLFLPGEKEPRVLAADNPGLHLLQEIRDEAHRFAITGHRLRRAKARQKSRVETIPGIGPHRRRQLLTQFGGLQALRKASVQALSKVPGISQSLASHLYHALKNL